MICDECQTGGFFSTQANAAVNETVKAANLREAKQSHARCPGGTWCDCQHFTGQALNTTLIAALARGAEVRRSSTEAVPIGFRSPL